MRDVLILGPQRRSPILGPALADAGMTGPLAAITAGWQEREAELAALEEHLGERVHDLRLYARAEDVFARDPALHEAYRARQQELRNIQDLYRVRLDHAKAAIRDLRRVVPVTSSLRTALAAAVAALQRLDREHLRAIDRVHRRFDAEQRPAERSAVLEHAGELTRLATAARTILIAGGHVAVLGNRLRLLGASRWLQGKAIAAWSAGAMAIAERVVLFHDRPAHGLGNAELFERGLGLVAGVVLLPDAVHRLALDDSDRVALLARRFRPAACYMLDDGDWLRFRSGVLVGCAGARRLRRSGTAAEPGCV